jgi:molecular chaperone DnaK
VSRYVLGIDLGTVNSCVAVVRDGRPVVLADDTRTTIPSAVAYAQDKELIGEPARRQALSDPKSAFVATKRLIGHAFDSKEVSAAKERMAYEIHPSPMGSVLLRAAGRELTPVQVAARILHRIREVASEALGESVERAVISVPAHFNEIQRRATKLAAEYAGLQVLRLVNEPTAAAFAYGYRKGEDFRLAVYDLGGGTFDVTIMQAKGDTFEVLASDGDSYLGGEDVDNLVADWIAGEYRSRHGKDPLEDPSARLRLKEAAEKAKVDLTDVQQARIELPYLLRSPDGSFASFECTLAREKLEELTAPILNKTLELCKRCLKGAKIQKEDLQAVLLVGGQTRMPAVRNMVRDFFGKEPRRDVNPDEVVALGAALYGYSLEAEKLKLEAEESAEEAFAVALKQTARVREIVEEVEALQSEMVSDDELARRITDFVAQAQAELPQLRADLPELYGDADLDLPAAIGGLKEELYELKLKVDKVREHSRKLDTGTAAKPRPTPPAAAKPHATPPAAAKAPATPAPRLELELPHDRVGPSSPPAPSPEAPASVAQAVEVVSEWLARASASSERAQVSLEEASEHARARKVRLRDVTSHALGIGAVGDLLSVLIEKNAKVPAETKRMFSTHHDNQREVHIRVFQGEDKRATRNELLGQFMLTGIEPAPRLEPKIEVSFQLDEDGILHVKARDQRTGAAQEITVKGPLALEKVEDRAADSAAEASLPPPQTPAREPSDPFIR